MGFSEIADSMRGQRLNSKIMQILKWVWPRRYSFDVPLLERGDEINRDRRKESRKRIHVYSVSVCVEAGGGGGVCVTGWGFRLGVLLQRSGAAGCMIRVSC